MSCCCWIKTYRFFHDKALLLLYFPDVPALNRSADYAANEKIPTFYRFIPPSFFSLFIQLSAQCSIVSNKFKVQRCPRKCFHFYVELIKSNFSAKYHWNNICLFKQFTNGKKKNKSRKHFVCHNTQYFLCSVNETISLDRKIKISMDRHKNWHKKQIKFPPIRSFNENVCTVFDLVFTMEQTANPTVRLASSNQYELVWTTTTVHIVQIIIGVELHYE